ncbi:MICOS complex subunit MIC19-like [Gigantopelta aegis]|uniref:MICOS complex subunit MIC19-like n=1 Tax=Gigantopelta aegis TaxID=1735272 RepID=UPI001B888D4F|nr:MICOS complex subunit MIC19-like [Gigantopelta aegis]
MGATGSTHRVVVEQMDETGVVKISESVVKRLKGEADSEDCFRPSPAPEVTIPRPFPRRTEGEMSALLQMENFYKQKLQELDAKNDALLKTSVDQFAKAVQEVEKKFMKHSSSPVCQDLQSKVYNCYIENECKTLNCAKEVRDFTCCVEKSRQNAITRKACP